MREGNWTEMTGVSLGQLLAIIGAVLRTVVNLTLSFESAIALTLVARLNGGKMTSKKRKISLDFARIVDLNLASYLMHRFLKVSTEQHGYASSNSPGCAGVRAANNSSDAFPIIDL